MAEVEEGKAPDVPGSAEGLGGPNATPTFGNKPQTDNNRPVEQQSELDSFVEGANAASNRNVISDDLLAVASAGEEHEGHAQYASPSIARLKLGPYQFENGVLRIPNEKVEHFEKLLKGASSRTQQAIRKIDRQQGEAVARRFLEQTKGKRTQGVDTTASTEGTQPNPTQAPKPLLTTGENKA